jgi:hypothetical protein
MMVRCRLGPDRWSSPGGDTAERSAFTLRIGSLDERFAPPSTSDGSVLSRRFAFGRSAEPLTFSATPLGFVVRLVGETPLLAD